MTHYGHHNSVSVPLQWSGHQAKTVIDFLEAIVETIWEIHEDAIRNEYKRRTLDFVRTENADDWPF